MPTETDVTTCDVKQFQQQDHHRNAPLAFELLS